jgi:hypothetical protein
MAYDFEKFRKYYGVYADAPAPWKPPVGEGWHGLIFDALVQIDKIVGGDATRFRIDQIKEKFGSLCLYHTADESVREALDKIEIDLENRSETMCETCGEKAKIYSYSSWYKCLCPTHGAEILFEGEGFKKLSGTGWKLGKIDARVVLIDKSSGGELGDEKLREIDARVEANAAAIKAERAANEGRGFKSKIGGAAHNEVVAWRHAKFIARR